MIRREYPLADGSPGWLLISQIEHARLAGDLARHWQAPPYAPLQPRDEVLAAIYHHDDGWAAWEQAPEIDSQDGRPREFLEMRLPVALDIWRGSIDASRSFGPLAGAIVAGHFLALLSHSHEANASAARAWTEEFSQLCADWLAEFYRDQSAAIAEESADTALKHLQMFDAISLWFCRAERTAPQEFEPPHGPKLTITPQADERTVLLAPWPLSSPDCTLSVTGRLVPALLYESAQQLTAAPAQEVTLTWRLSP